MKVISYVFGGLFSKCLINTHTHTQVLIPRACVCVLLGYISSPDMCVCVYKRRRRGGYMYGRRSHVCVCVCGPWGHMSAVPPTQLLPLLHSVRVMSMITGGFVIGPPRRVTLFPPPPTFLTGIYTYTSTQPPNPTTQPLLYS